LKASSGSRMIAEKENKRVKTINPATEDVLNEYDIISLAKIARQSLCKAVKEVRSEVEKCAWVMEYYADNGQIISRDEVVNTDARKSVITFRPIGVIGSVMP
jgi:acyl-CoA reductase-like NAD-dependent aldehyde dehydrogenase